jgi:hypothetical protein
MKVKILFVTNYIIPKDAKGSFIPKPKETQILQAILKANKKLSQQGMNTATILTNPLINDGNIAYVKKIWKINRIETPMLCFVTFPYNDTEAYDVLTTLYGTDMNETKIYETLEFFHLLIPKNGKYIQPDGKEWTPISKKGAKEGNKTTEGASSEGFEWAIRTTPIPIVDNVVIAAANLMGDAIKPLLLIGGILSSAKAINEDDSAKKTAYGVLATYLLVRYGSIEKKVVKKVDKLGSPYHNAVRSAKKYACDKTYKQALDFNLNEMEKEVLRKAELKNRERYQKVLSHATLNCIKGIGSIRKSRFMEPYKQIGMPGLWSSITNIQFAIGKIGVYLIKKNNEFAYIGKGTNVYKTCLRHFEPHKNDGHNKQDYWQDVESQHYTVQIVVTTSLQEAEVLERALQFYYTPIDNINIPSEIEPYERNALDKYLSVPSESF